MNEVVRIVQRLTPQLGEPEGEATPLTGGITNRNYRVRMGGADYVIRVPGKNTSLLEIDRRAEHDANQAAAKAGLAPAVAAVLDDPQALVTEFLTCEEMTPEELREPEARDEVARALRAFHDSGLTLSTEFNSFRIVETYAETAKEHGVEIPAAYDQEHARAREIESALRGPEHEPVPCHNDLLAANFLLTADGIRIVDWEYAGMGDRYFDLANFCINNELTEDDHAALLEAYFSPAPKGSADLESRPPADRLADLRLMMFMSDFREAMWGVVQSGVSDLDFDFEEYADKHFKRLRETAADPGFARALEDARAAPG
jgi:thiamine kinase-like enzyme